jgi:ADP-ribosylglycohydrolase
MRPKDHVSRMERARLALCGLSVGDAFGERFFINPDVVETLIEARAVPKQPWGWTDDTAMALSVVDVLDAHGEIDRDALAHAFARRYAADPARGYGGTAHGILQAIKSGIPWQHAAGSAFGGDGSMGNGAAMRVAPIGAYFSDDLDAVVENAGRSADPTHAHADGKAGAIAVAVGAALASRPEANGLAPEEWLRAILERTPSGATHDGIAKALDLPLSYDVRTAVAALGNGSLVISSDTVPLSLWCAARHMTSYEDALWTTVSALGDRDTTCAIVGGIVVLATGRVPETWLAAREELR